MSQLLYAQVPVHAAAVIPSDTAETRFVALWIGTAGDVAVVTEGGETVTFKAVTSGGSILQSGTKVMATGTTATNILRQW